jgi:hypothetical protein
MAQASDADSDDGRAMDSSPWPAFVKESVWKGQFAIAFLASPAGLVADRVVLRKQLKQKIAQYAELHSKDGRAIAEFTRCPPCLRLTPLTCCAQVLVS